MLRPHTARVPISAGVLVALVVACGSAEAANERRSPPPARVSLADVSAGELTVERRYLGEVRAVTRATLAAGASGQVVEVSAREGDGVARGALLLRLDPNRARARLGAARAAAERAALEQAQAEREAARFAGAGEAVAAIEAERAAASAVSLEAAESELRSSVAEARETLARHRVVAPFAGVVAARLVDLGDWVDEGEAVLELVDPERVEVFVRVEPELLANLAPDHPVSLRQGTRRRAGRVGGVVPAADATTRTAQLRIVASEGAGELLPGTTVDVVLSVRRGGEGVLVPRDALVPGVAETRVFVVREGAAVPIAVEVLDRSADAVRVRAEELAAGDRVIVRGNDRLSPGQAVLEDAPAEPGDA